MIVTFTSCLNFFTRLAGSESDLGAERAVDLDQ